MFGAAQLKGILLVILYRTILFAPVLVENNVRLGPGEPLQVPAELDGAEKQLFVLFH
jgi:hypothetical protein